MTSIDLRRGAYQKVLNDVTVDAVISDPPYSAGVHAGHNEAKRQRKDATAQSVHREIRYDAFTPSDVFDFVSFWAPRNRGWFAVMSCSDLAHVWRGAFYAFGLYTFAPVFVRSFTPRLLGDGPSRELIFLNVARPRLAEYARGGGTRPSSYVESKEKNRRIGGKSRQLMRSIVGDYTRPNDLVCDPFGGYATTLLAARDLGCRAIGSEIDEHAHAEGMQRVARPWQMQTHPRAEAPAAAEQGSLC